MLDCLQSYNHNEIVAIATNNGYPKFRGEQLYTFMMQYKSFNKANNLPNALVLDISTKYLSQGVEIIKILQSKDGTKKYLFKLADGNIIEGVYMSYDYGNTLCVSTQVGCRMGCVFCASGIGGLVRNLSSGEILSQVLAVNRDNCGTLEERKVTNVVLMGSGEPLDNYDNVVKFLLTVSESNGINISPRNISLSTSGIVPRMLEIAELDIPFNLTISLHATTDEKRSDIMPINRKYNIKEVINASKNYFDKTKRRIIFEYSLIEGKNSDLKSAHELVTLVKGLPCHINLINLNYVEEKGLMSADNNAIQAFVKVLEQANISVTVRRSMGADIQGACGQLRRQFIDGGHNNE